jgi:hypothetical protein
MDCLRAVTTAGVNPITFVTVKDWQDNNCICDAFCSAVFLRNLIFRFFTLRFKAAITVMLSIGRLGVGAIGGSLPKSFALIVSNSSVVMSGGGGVFTLETREEFSKRHQYLREGVTTPGLIGQTCPLPTEFSQQFVRFPANARQRTQNVKAHVTANGYLNW